MTNRTIMGNNYLHNMTRINIANWIDIPRYAIKSMVSVYLVLVSHNKYLLLIKES